VSQTVAYIKRLEDLQEGERSRLRRLAGQPLDATVAGFDLFTGLWWPLRAKNEAAPRREISWLVAKLYGSFPVPHVRPEEGVGPSLATVVGHCEPPCPACPGAALLSSAPPDREPARGQFTHARTFRRRFDALLCSPLPSLEPHLRWALGEVARAVAGRVPYAQDVAGLDWARLLDDLSIWDRGEEHRRKRDIRDLWAEAYLHSVNPTERRIGTC
jgi:CRISPR type I-E-associated protein CasB/Cse2